VVSGSMAFIDIEDSCKGRRTCCIILMGNTRLNGEYERAISLTSLSWLKVDKCKMANISKTHAMNYFAKSTNLLITQDEF